MDTFTKTFTALTARSAGLFFLELYQIIFNRLTQFRHRHLVVVSFHYLDLMGLWNWQHAPLSPDMPILLFEPAACVTVALDFSIVLLSLGTGSGSGASTKFQGHRTPPCKIHGLHKNGRTIQDIWNRSTRLWCFGAITCNRSYKSWYLTRRHTTTFLSRTKPPSRNRRPPSRNFSPFQVRSGAVL